MKREKETPKSVVERKNAAYCVVLSAVFYSDCDLHFFMTSIRLESSVFYISICIISTARFSRS